MPAADSYELVPPPTAADQHPEDSSHSPESDPTALAPAAASVFSDGVIRRQLLLFLSVLLLGFAVLRSSQFQPFTHAGEQEMNWANSTQNKRSVGYYTSWSIYDRKYLPQEIPAHNLTHLLYAFANVNKETGEVILTDSWADQEIHWEGDSWNDAGTNVYGCFKQLMMHKKRNRHLRVLLSIGGWTFSSNFPNLVHASHRTRFCESAIRLLEDLGLDGIDIDWEYPSNAAESRAYVELLGEMRQALDSAQSRRNGTAQFDLTVAAPCGPDKIAQLDIPAMDRYLSFWNLMAYDFAGSWSNATAHQAQLFGPPDEPSVDRAVQAYREKGVRPDKLVVGLPLYGRSFANTDGIGSSSSGVGEGTWEAGMYDYRALPRPGAQVGEDLQRGVAWTYDPAKREYVSFDSPNSAAAKARYVRSNGLGGLMYWELDADLRPADPLAPHALVPIVTEEMGGIARHVASNCLEYPWSRFDNVKNGMA